jgi:hypothetical protein
MQYMLVRAFDGRFVRIQPDINPKGNMEVWPDFEWILVADDYVPNYPDGYSLYIDLDLVNFESENIISSEELVIAGASSPSISKKHKKKAKDRSDEVKHFREYSKAKGIVNEIKSRGDAVRANAKTGTDSEVRKANKLAEKIDSNSIAELSVAMDNLESKKMLYNTELSKAIIAKVNK